MSYITDIIGFITDWQFKHLSVKQKKGVPTKEKNIYINEGVFS